MPFGGSLNNLIHPKHFTANLARYPQVATLETVTEAQAPSGAIRTPDSAWSAVPSLTGLRCQIAPVRQQVREGEVMTKVEERWHISFPAHYPTINEDMRIVVHHPSAPKRTRQVYEIDSVEHDSQNAVTRLIVEQWRH